jgi:uncharacterized protein
MDPLQIKDLFITFNNYLQKKFNTRVYKICVDGGFTCPNRDGTYSKKGCIFCDARGSSSLTNCLKTSIIDQILTNLEFRRTRYKAKKFIVYFQSFTNTYADIKILKEKYDAAISAHKDIVGLSISTRPDCITEEIVKLIASYKDKLEYVSLELGMQSMHDKTLKEINRCETHLDFLNALSLCKKYKLPCTAHIILGLPGETKEDMLNTAKTLANLNIEGIKIHLLVAMKNTALESLYNQGKWEPLSFEKYIEIICDIIEIMPKDCIIHRFSGSGHPMQNVAPKWTINTHKNVYMKALIDELKKRKTHQGIYKSE